LIVYIHVQQRFGAWRSGGLEVQMFKLVLKLIESTNAQFSTNAPILPNPCCAFVVFF